MKTLEKQLIERKNELTKIQNDIEKFLKNAPKGTLYVVRNKSGTQFYLKPEENKSKKRYIKKREIELVKNLAQKEYSKKVLKITKKQMECLEKFERVYEENGIVNVYETMDKDKRKYITPYELPNNEYAEKWMCEQIAIKEKINKTYKDKYDINDISEECAIITEKGERVRSKSEKILADKLNLMGIPYVYEVPVELKGWGYVRPDFKVLNKRTGQEYFWEHFGLMDQEDYCKKTIDKIEKYEKNGMFVGRHVIVTFESSSQPINSKVIENKIREFLQ